MLLIAECKARFEFLFYRLNQSTQCPFCSESGICDVKPDKGHERELRRMEISCPRCNENFSGRFPELIIHLDKHRDLPCPNCAEKFVFPQELDSHQYNTCEHRVVECPLSFLGCDKKVPHKYIDKHHLNNWHQRYLLNFVHAILSPSSLNKILSTDSKNTEQTFEQTLREYLEKINPLIEDADQSMRNCSQLSSKRQDIETKINGIRTQSVAIKESSENNVKLMESIYQIIANMTEILNKMKSQPIGGPRLLDIDGTYIWKVKLSDLTSSQQTLQSEVFLTSKSGYKLVLQCEIYENKSTSTSYISVAVAILRGDYDAILSWPMLYPITLTIVDLSGKRSDISYPIHMDPYMLPLQRPMNDSNPPCKVEQFYPLEKITKNNSYYVQNNAMFIRAHLDFVGGSLDSISNGEQQKLPNYDSARNKIAS
ncbi:unnamed protein product [Adineta ricciae]|uniref:MATH domain-containing protein n=1 Tax=Adineta ricciae TaxID=249248 RepID=A0A815SEU8_ADIRI|nr:unnamed protein product [Adineta ricciae]